MTFNNCAQPWGLSPQYTLIMCFCACTLVDTIHAIVPMCTPLLPLHHVTFLHSMYINKKADQQYVVSELAPCLQMLWFTVSQH
jgi:hypothetical protein